MVVSVVEKLRDVGVNVQDDVQVCEVLQFILIQAALKTVSSSRSQVIVMLP
jgi:hypothetical protein